MALPTASTPGYGLFRGEVACDCLAEWIPWAEKVCIARGYIKFNFDILQLTGDYSLSGNTHNAGGVFDIKQYDVRIVLVLREMGAPATWLRNMLYADGSPGNTHTHGVLSGCPHNWPAAYQITAQARGYNGMGKGTVYPYVGVWGYGGKDPHPDPLVYRTWKQGIEWAKQELAKTPTEEDELMAVTVKNPATGEMWTLSNALWSIWTYVLENRANLAVLNKAVIGLAESERLDDAEREAAVADIAARVRLVQESTEAMENLLKEQPPDPPEPDPAFTFGFDMSGHQTVEQVQAQLDNPDMSFAIIKATEGYTFVSSRFEAQAAAVNASDIAMRGWYHFGWQSHDGKQEAQHFWRTIEPYARSGDCWFGDIENWDQVHNYADMAGVTWEQRFDFYMDFRAEMQVLSGSLGSIYPLWTVIKAFRELCGMKNEDGTIKSTPTPEWLEFTEAGLWLPQYMIGTGDARHAVQPGEYDFVSGGWDLFIHQYTSSPFDKNWMPGGKQLWSRHAIP